MPEQGLNLLSLDGDGVCSIATLQILKRLMEVLNPVTPPKPCDYFDLISGTNAARFVRSNVICCA